MSRQLSRSATQEELVPEKWQQFSDSMDSRRILKLVAIVLLFVVALSLLAAVIVYEISQPPPRGSQRCTDTGCRCPEGMVWEEEEWRWENEEGRWEEEEGRCKEEGPTGWLALAGLVGQRQRLCAVGYTWVPWRERCVPHSR